MSGSHAQRARTGWRAPSARRRAGEGVLRQEQGHQNSVVPLHARPRARAREHTAGAEVRRTTAPALELLTLTPQRRGRRGTAVPQKVEAPTAAPVMKPGAQAAQPGRRAAGRLTTTWLDEARGCSCIGAAMETGASGTEEKAKSWLRVQARPDATRRAGRP